MLALTPDEIVVAKDRFRKEFPEKKQKELREGILSIGLLHPITVEVVGEEYHLRAGERRLRVLTQLLAEGTSFKHGQDVYSTAIPCIDWAELSEQQRLEIEVRENIDRLDFAWDERVKATAALHKFLKSKNPNQSIKDTAAEIRGEAQVGGEAQRVSNALIIEKHLHLPEVAKAKDEKQAMKVIEKIAAAGHRAKLVAAAVKTVSPHRLIKGAALESLQSMPDGVFDVVLTDPIYGIDAQAFGEMASTGHDYKDSYKTWKEFFTYACDELYRVTKPAAHCYLFCDQRRFEELATLMTLANWTVFPSMLIWVKENGMVPFPDHGPRRTYECILYAWKGGRKTLQLKSDVIRVPAVKKLKHGAQKPVALYRELLTRSANPGDTVLDFMGGSGTILVAANLMNCKATYIEQNEDSFNIAKLRENIKEIDDGAEERDGLEDLEV